MLTASFIKKKKKKKKKNLRRGTACRVMNLGTDVVNGAFIRPPDVRTH
jgi:hypothetical protein